MPNDVKSSNQVAFPECIALYFLNTTKICGIPHSDSSLLVQRCMRIINTVRCARIVIVEAAEASCTLLRCQSIVLLNDLGSILYFNDLEPYTNVLELPFANPTLRSKEPSEAVMARDALTRLSQLQEHRSDSRLNKRSDHKCCS